MNEVAPGREVLTVSQLNRSVAVLLEHQLPPVWVTGEISNFSSAGSGHWYFSLKDAAAAVRVVMFRGRNQAVGFTPGNGDRVEVRAQVTLYEARGDFQLNAEMLRRAGAGDLFQQFLRLKAQLAAEGLFDVARKRPIPAAPRCIGVVTSQQAAALRDVLTTLARRAPQVPVIVYPAAVQGGQAPGELIRALQRAVQRAECDVLLLVRGGGSLEDLWAFNEEGLARAIAASPIPVISGVGHETDVSIADWVADLRAPTPTAAAVAAVPDRQTSQRALQGLRERLVHVWRRQAEQREQRLDTAIRLLRPPSIYWAQRRGQLEQMVRRWAMAGERSFGVRWSRLEVLAQALRPPEWRARQARLNALERALATAQKARLATVNDRLVHASAALELVSPRAVLARGYAIVTGPDGQIVRDAASVAPGEHVAVALGHGSLDARVIAAHRDD